MATVCDTYNPETSDAEEVQKTLKGVATTLESLYTEFDLCWCAIQQESISLPVFVCLAVMEAPIFLRAKNFRGLLSAFVCVKFQKCCEIARVLCSD